MKLNKEVTSYLVFGVLTTVVNIVVYFIFTHWIVVDYKVAVTIAWIVSVLFAYVTNKLYVFQANKRKTKDILKELFLFFGFRITSYFLDLFTMILLVHYLGLQDLLSKVISNVGVVIFNYIASKFFIFRK